MDWTVTNDDAASAFPLAWPSTLFPGHRQPRAGARPGAGAKVDGSHRADSLGPACGSGDGPADSNQPVALSELNLDDVFWGLKRASRR